MTPDPGDSLHLPADGGWSPRCLLQTPSTEEAGAFRARVSEDRDALEIAFTPPDQGWQGRVSLLLDPVGDLEAFHEITVDLPALTSGGSFFRRNRSGYRRDFRWRCEGLQIERIETGLLHLKVPRNALGTTSFHPGWRGNLFATPLNGGPIAFWKSPLGALLYDPARFGTLVFPLSPENE